MYRVRPRHGLGNWISLLALVVLWGTAFAFIREAVDSNSPLSVAAGRIVTAAVALYVGMRALGLRLPRSGRVWLYFLMLGVVGNALPFWLISWGQERVESGLAGILMAVNPLVTLGLAHLFVAGERLTLARLSGFALGFAGVVALFVPEVRLAWAGEGAEWIRRAAVLGGALCYATNSILARRMPDTPALVASAGVLIAAGVFMVPAALALDLPLARVPSPTSLVALLWLGLVPTAAATILYFRVVASAGPTFLSLVNYPVPIVAVAVGAVVYGERLGLRSLAALALVLAGIALSQLSNRSRDRGSGLL